jgi:hypothetical protein
MNKAMIPLQLASLCDLTQLFDDTMTRLLDNVSLPFFGVAPDTLGEFCNLPILQTARAKQDQFFQRWAMMDVAHYFNDQEVFDRKASKKLPENINCAAHFDPGLLSLSVLSTTPGLELFDFACNAWYRFDNSDEEQQRRLDPDDGKGNNSSRPSAGLGHDKAILWCGKAANFANSEMYPCVHRVTREVGRPRLAMWYEICTASQGTAGVFGFCFCLFVCFFFNATILTLSVL